jgi:HlyD family secretion protein
MMTRQRKIQLGIAIGCGSLLSLGLMFGKGGDEGDTFSWDDVSRGELRETIQASGEIQARTRVNIGTNVAAEIKAIHVRDGQEVSVGQPLVSLDQVRVTQQLFQVKALLDAARKDAARLQAATRRAREVAQRNESLFKQGLISDDAYHQAQVDKESADLSYESAKANVSQNEANVAAIRDGLDKTQIVAPISGRVTALKAAVGEMAIPGTSNLPGATLMVISDMKELNAEIRVNESEVVRLKGGQPVQVNVESLPGHLFRGHVYEIASAADPSGQNANMYTVKVALDMSNPETAILRPGMSARGIILTAHVKNAVRVPLQSVLERDGTLEEALRKGLLSPESHSVVIVVRNGKAQEQTVRTGIADTQFYETVEGLSAGDRVLTGPSKKLKELRSGTAVTLRNKSDTEVEKDARRSAV